MTSSRPFMLPAVCLSVTVVCPGQTEGRVVPFAFGRPRAWSATKGALGVKLMRSHTSTDASQPAGAPAPSLTRSSTGSTPDTDPLELARSYDDHMRSFEVRASHPSVLVSLSTQPQAELDKQTRSPKKRTASVSNKSVGSASIGGTSGGNGASSVGKSAVSQVLCAT